MEEINLQELFDYYKSKIILALLIILLVVVVGNIYSLVIRKPLYASETTVLLVSEDNQTSYNTNDLTLNQKLVATYSEIIKSRKILNTVINALNLKYTYSELYNMVSVSSVQDTEIIRIRVSSENPGEAKDIADATAKYFSSEVKDKFKLSNISILDSAIVAKKPYNENYLKDNIIYLLVGIVGGLVIIFIMFYFDTTIKNSDTLESKYGFNVMGVVPYVGGSK